MVTSDVTSAIVNAKPGIQKYLALMSQVETSRPTTMVTVVPEETVVTAQMVKLLTSI